MSVRRRSDPARAARRAARREDLLEAALRVLRREGPGATMEAIAAEAGVTKPIFYRYFGDRDGLGQAIAERCMAELMDDLRAALTKDASPRELLVATIDAYVAFVERDPDVHRFLVEGWRSGRGGQEALVGFVRQVARDVAIVLGERLRDAGADSGAAEPWAYGLVGMVHMAGDWWVDRRSMTRARLVEYLASLVWEGMSAVAGADELPAPRALPVARGGER